MSGRPKAGYYIDGKRVPGVTTIIGRFKEAGGLIQWAYRCGMDGIDINAAKEDAADAGTCCHEMIDCELHGRGFDRSQWKPEILAKADHAFLAYLEWAEQSNLKVVESETSLVSAVYRFGGTFDALMVGKRLVLGDYKTSGGIYSDMLVQVAGGYAILWEEHHPDRPLDGIEILRFSKPQADDDPISFSHHYWSAEIFPIAKRQFIRFREAYEDDKRLGKMV